MFIVWSSLGEQIRQAHFKREERVHANMHCVTMVTRADLVLWMVKSVMPVPARRRHWPFWRLAAEISPGHLCMTLRLHCSFSHAPRTHGSPWLKNERCSPGLLTALYQPSTDQIMAFEWWLHARSCAQQLSTRVCVVEHVVQVGIVAVAVTTCPWPARPV